MFCWACFIFPYLLFMIFHVKYHKKCKFTDCPWYISKKHPLHFTPYSDIHCSISFILLAALLNSESVFFFCFVFFSLFVCLFVCFFIRMFFKPTLKYFLILLIIWGWNIPLTILTLQRGVCITFSPRQILLLTFYRSSLCKNYLLKILSLVYVYTLNIFLKLWKFQPQYSYVVYSYKRWHFVYAWFRFL